jgi:signal peptidase I
MSSQSEQAPEAGVKSPRRARVEQAGRNLVLWLRTLTSAAVYATVIMTFGFQIARVEGHSMEPTLEDQDRLVVNKFAYHLHDPEVGDIVMLLHPANPRMTLVKRVVAEPGDTVAFREGLVLRNGAPAAEDFIPPGADEVHSGQNSGQVVAIRQREAFRTVKASAGHPRLTFHLTY